MLSTHAQVIWVMPTPLLAASVSVLCDHQGEEDVMVSIIVPSFKYPGVQLKGIVTHSSVIGTVCGNTR